MKLYGFCDNFPKVIIGIIVLVFAVIVCEYVFWIWNSMMTSAKMPAIVLTKDVSVIINGKECQLPRGLVLYPLNELECGSEIYDGRTYKIYIETNSLNYRELGGSEIDGSTNLIYRLDVGCEYK